MESLSAYAKRFTKERPQIPCDCKCGRSDRFARMVPIPIKRHNPVTGAVFTERTLRVTEVCFKPFMEEITLSHAFNELVRGAAGQPFWKRARHARSVYRLQKAISIRVLGGEKATEAALRAALLFSIPASMAGVFTGWFERIDAARVRQIQAASDADCAKLEDMQ